MIPTIRNRIDDSNNANENGDGQRISIPTLELAELIELRKTEHTRRAREGNYARILEAEARANEKSAVAVDEQRPYGLPLGEAREDVWESILKYVDDVEDVRSLRGTCVLFRELLERKYRILSFVEIVLKLGRKYDGFPSEFNLRQLCKISRAAVEKASWEEKLRYELNLEPLASAMDDLNLVNRIRFRLRPREPLLKWLHALLCFLETFPKSYLPIKVFSVMEISGAEVRDTARNNPFLPTLRIQVHRLLELMGCKIRYFEYISVHGVLATFVTLRNWLILMPSLEDLSIMILTDEPDNEVPLRSMIRSGVQFPSLPKLRKYMIKGPAFSAPFVAEIFRANPGIEEVVLHYLPFMNRGPEDFSAVLTTLNILPLEKFKVLGLNCTPPVEFLHFRFDKWPLKSLSLHFLDQEENNRETSSRTLFAFINSFTATLEELECNWKIRDNGGYLDTPKVTKLCYKLWPSFMNLEFLIALENLQYLDVDVESCEEINGSVDDMKAFFGGSDLPALIPLLRRIRVRNETGGGWLQI